jgi:hypothetical protein
MLGIRSLAQLAKQEPQKMYEKLNRKNWTAPGPMRAGHLLCGGGAGAEPAIAGGAMPVVVLEQKEEVSK